MEQLCLLGLLGLGVNTYFSVQINFDSQAHNAIQFDNNFDSFSFDRHLFGDISIIISISLIHEKIHCMFLIHSK